jgi:hypothetical protein
MTVTDPNRINFLLSAAGPIEDEYMLAAAVVAENGVVSPVFEAKYPGVQAYVHVANGMFSDTKEKKKLLRKWLVSQNGPQPENFAVELPMLD